ncbi:MAG: RecX family transcriptional regulator [Acidobacteria bacterium]|nr:RecX family transcriptional regulator [Acidobacteriota bacterium]
MASFASHAKKKLGPEALYEYAVAALGRRALTERELRLKLAQCAADEAHVDETLGRLQAIGYLDDQRTAESHAYSKRELEGLGARRVLNELRRRGIDQSTAERTVEEAYREVDELELIRQYLERKMGRRLEGKLEDPREVHRLTQRLMRAGFSVGRIREALGRVAADPAWLEGLEEPFDGDE